MGHKGTPGTRLLDRTGPCPGWSTVPEIRPSSCTGPREPPRMADKVMWGLMMEPQLMRWSQSRKTGSRSRWRRRCHKVDALLRCAPGVAGGAHLVKSVALWEAPHKEGEAKGSASAGTGREAGRPGWRKSGCGRSLLSALEGRGLEDVEKEGMRLRWRACADWPSSAYQG